MTMTKSEARRLARAEAEVERLRREHERQGVIIRSLLHEVVALKVARDAIAEVLDEVRDV